VARAVISWIVASHHWPTLRDNLGATIRGIDADEVVVVENPTGIAAAYNEGQARATQPVRCYVHHDVVILQPKRIRDELIAATADAGLVGVIGSRDMSLPWWDGDTLGSVVDARLGLLDFGPGGPCDTLDGLLLATVHDISWDESIPGFHGYDYDACRQLLERGFRNFCLTAGHELVRHNTAGPTNPDHLTGWAEALSRLREKWGGQDRTG
jgi:hypothetical protein